MKDTDTMSALHITDEIIALDTDTEWTHYTQPNVPHTMKHSQDFNMDHIESKLKKTHLLNYIKQLYHTEAQETKILLNKVTSVVGFSSIF